MQARLQSNLRQGQPAAKAAAAGQAVTAVNNRKLLKRLLEPTRVLVGIHNSQERPQLSSPRAGPLAEPLVAATAAILKMPQELPARAGRLQRAPAGTAFLRMTQDRLGRRRAGRLAQALVATVALLGAQ